LIVRPQPYCESPGDEECIEMAEFNIILEKGEGTSATYADYDYGY
jgi:hypothetical protein